MSKPSPRAKNVPVSDPNAIPETVCDGPLNVQFGDGRATITLTHLRAKTVPLLERGQIDLEAIVRARIVFSMGNLIALKNLLNQLIPDKPPTEGAAAASGGASLH